MVVLVVIVLEEEENNEGLCGVWISDWKCNWCLWPSIKCRTGHGHIHASGLYSVDVASGDVFLVFKCLMKGFLLSVFPSQAICWTMMLL